MTRFIVLAALCLAACGPDAAPVVSCGSSYGATVVTDGTIPCHLLAEDAYFAFSAGVRGGMWPSGQTWSGWSIDFSEAAGPVTVNQATRSITVSLANVSPGVDGEQLARGQLVVGLLHATEGDNRACNWSQRQPVLTAISAAMLGATEPITFTDECLAVTCTVTPAGATCSTGVVS